MAVEFGIEMQSLIEEADKDVADKQAALDKAQAKKDKLEAIVKQVEQDKVDAKKADYEEGYADGKASIVLPDPKGEDKIYSQAEVNDIVNKSEAKKDQEKQDALDQAKKEADEALAVEKERADENEGAKEERDQLVKQAEDDKQALEDMRKDIDARIDEAAQTIGQ